jgi:hypothetical protein
MARNRKTLLVRPVGNRCAVAFVANERVIRSKGVAVAQPGPLEDPVFGMLYPVADGFALTPPLTAAITMADASQAVFRINIEPLVSLLVIAGKLGLVANKGGVALHQVNPPPAGIAAEEGDVSAVFHKGLDIAPHLLAPVFVMTDAEEEPIGFQKIPKVLMYIEIGTIIDRKASAFEPTDKRRVPMPEGLPRR